MTPSKANCRKEEEEKLVKFVPDSVGNTVRVSKLPRLKSIRFMQFDDSFLLAVNDEALSANVSNANYRTLRCIKLKNDSELIADTKQRKKL